MFYGVYANGNTGTAYGNGNGKTSLKTSNGIGMGIHGGFMGGYVKGSQYGLIQVVKNLVCMFKGKTITNEPIVQITEGDNKRVVSYYSASINVDVNTRGTGKLSNGLTFVAYTTNATNGFDNPCMMLLHLE